MISPGANTGSSEQYDGTSWVTAPSMATARRALGGCGTQTSGLGFGGIITTFFCSHRRI
jgi:hypothetical protein